MARQPDDAGETVAVQDLVGQQIGPYRVTGLLGHGGMASVYRAVQPGLEREIALKVLTEEQAALDPEFAERFRREATAIARLRHPNIVSVIDFGKQPGLTYLAMELAPAGSLRDFAGMTLPLEYAAQIVVQVAAALDAAHEQGIVHRDVKPANILFQDRGSLFDPAGGPARPPWVMLADFGIARLSSERSLTQAGTGIGTPEYMSPEQVTGQKVDGRSDIYALGIVLYEMLTGDVPFRGKSPLQVAMQQAQTPLPSPRAINPAIPAAVETVILTACAKRPEDRYPSAGAFAAAVAAAAGLRPGATSTSPGPPLGAASATPMRPRRGRAGCRRFGLGLLAMAALLVASGMTAAWRRERSTRRGLAPR